MPGPTPGLGQSDIFLFRTRADCAKNLDIQCGEPVSVKAPSATLDVSEVALNGNLKVSGDVEVGGNVDVAGTVMDGAGNSNHYSH